MAPPRPGPPKPPRRGPPRSPRREARLRSASDALRVVTRVGDRSRHQTILVLLDEQRAGSGCVVVEPTPDPASVFDVAELAIGRGQPVAVACILASVRPDADAQPDDVDRWFELLDLFDDAGVDLLDWYVVGPDSITSLRDATGCRPVWPP